MAKVILVTGASTGLGESLCDYLLSKGYIVYGTSRSIQTGSKKFTTLPMDVSNNDSVQQAVNQIIEKEGKIDVLINNAGLGIAGPIEYLPIENVQTVLNTNVVGVIRTCQAVLPHMRQRGSGLVINISSIGSETGLPYRGAYSASKAAVDRITEALRIELAPYSVQACYVQPGGIQTDINRNRLMAPLPPDAPYNESFNRCYALINESVSKGLPTSVFGPAIEKIIESKKVKRSYRIGKPLEKLSVLLKSILPDSKYEGLLKNHYKI